MRWENRRSADGIPDAVCAEASASCKSFLTLIYVSNATPKRELKLQHCYYLAQLHIFIVFALLNDDSTLKKPFSIIDLN